MPFKEVLPWKHVKEMAASHILEQCMLPLPLIQLTLCVLARWDINVNILSVILYASAGCKMHLFK